MSGSLSSPPSTLSSTFDPVANILSNVNLHHDCSSTLLQALVSTHPDPTVWLQSYYEEKGGIKNIDTFHCMRLGEYVELCQKRGSNSILTMCILTIKKDEQFIPLWEKSRIVVLGNQEDCNWSKSDHVAPVLRFDSIRFLVSLAVQRRRSLKQGSCKNSFCKGILPPDEFTIVPPPLSSLDAPKDEYWLLRSMVWCKPGWVTL